jgi:hypothetical protein
MGYDPLGVSLSREMAEELLAKYGEMLSMRLAHDSGDEDPGAVKERMAGLAARFPGALREIDELELDEIRRRIERLEAVLRSPQHEEPWMEAVGQFHLAARGALGAKRWLEGRKGVDARLEEEFLRQTATLPFSKELRGWAGDLARIASPPNGRVTDLVFARVASLIGTSVEEARRRVFGASRRLRSRAKEELDP